RGAALGPRLAVTHRARSLLLASRRPRKRDHAETHGPGLRAKEMTCRFDSLPCHDPRTPTREGARGGARTTRVSAGPGFRRLPRAPPVAWSHPARSTQRFTTRWSGRGANRKPWRGCAPPARRGSPPADPLHGAHPVG